jgi:hypothetical protein
VKLYETCWSCGLKFRGRPKPGNSHRVCLGGRDDFDMTLVVRLNGSILIGIVFPRLCSPTAPKDKPNVHQLSYAIHVGTYPSESHVRLTSGPSNSLAKSPHFGTWQVAARIYNEDPQADAEEKFDELSRFQLPAAILQVRHRHHRLSQRGLTKSSSDGTCAT